MVNILSSDLLITDIIVPMPEQAGLATVPAELHEKYTALNNLVNGLLEKNGVKHGGKIALSKDEFIAVSRAITGIPVNMPEPGGSTGNTSTTIKRLFDDKVSINFLGVTGDDPYSNIIRQDLERNNIKLISPESQVSIPSEPAISFIFTAPDGSRTIATYPGNAEEILKPEMITDELINKNDAVIIPYSLWEKFDSAFPDKLLQKSLEKDKRIILTLPQQAKFSHKAPANTYKKLIENADIIVGEEKTITSIYNTGNNFELAVKELQKDIEKRDKLRSESGKPPRNRSATAFIVRNDNSATIITAPSPSGVQPKTPAQRHDFPSTVNSSIGAEDSAYAGFIAGYASGLKPLESASLAMQVAETKSSYNNNIRIPESVSTNPETKDKWHKLQSKLGNSLSSVENAVSAALTGVTNHPVQKKPRTKGQKAFDLFVYPLIANFGVVALSIFVTYHSNFNQNKANPFVKRSDWFKDKLSKVPVFGKNPTQARNLNMIIWSFFDGSVMAPVVALFESKRQKISRWIDDKLGTTPEDKSVYDNEIKRSWKDIFKARAATFALVIATYFTLNAKIFPNSKIKGILGETPVNSGNFAREPVNSINGFIFDLPGKKIGGLADKIKPIHNWALKTSNKQLTKMAAGRSAGDIDARYQIEGLANTGLFEFVYTSLCTAGLYFIGKTFGKHRQHKTEQPDKSQKTLDDNPSQIYTAIKDRNTYDPIAEAEAITRKSAYSYKSKPAIQQPAKFTDRSTETTPAMPGY